MSFWTDASPRRAAPAIIGHRGAPKLATENTALSFEFAMAQGSHAIETDVRLTSDGHIVCFHDDDFLRLARRPERIDAVTLAEARTIFPQLLKFTDFLTMTSQFPVVVDTKWAGEYEIDRFTHTVKEHDSFGRSLFTAYTPANAELIRSYSPQATIGIFFLDGVDEITYAREVGAKWIRVLPQDYNRAALEMFRAEGLSTIAVASPLAKLGSAADRPSLQHLAALGLDAVIISDAELAVTAFEDTAQTAPAQ